MSFNLQNTLKQLRFGQGSNATTGYQRESPYGRNSIRDCLHLCEKRAEEVDEPVHRSDVQGMHAGKFLYTTVRELLSQHNDNFPQIARRALPFEQQDRPVKSPHIANVIVVAESRVPCS